MPGQQELAVTVSVSFSRLAKVSAILFAVATVASPGATLLGAQSSISVHIPTCNDAWYAENNLSCSAEQRARAGERKRERERDDQRKAAEQAAEKKRKDALVATEVGKMGSHREAEARRLVEMREAAERARAQPTGPGIPIKPAIKCEQKKVEASMDSRPEGASLLFTGFQTKPEAEASIRHKVGRACNAQTGTAGGSVSDMRCVAEGGRWICNARFACSALATGNCSNSQ